MNFASIAYVHGPDAGAISSNVLVGAAERVFGVVTDAVNYFARPAAGSLLIVALIPVCTVVQFERRR